MTAEGLRGRNVLIKSCSCYIIPLESQRIRPLVLGNNGVLATTIGDIASQSLVGRQIRNTLKHRQHGQSTDVLRTEHERSADKV